MDVSNLHEILRDLYNEMMPLCADMAGVAKGLAGLGALFYIAMRIWSSLARAEPIDVFPLLRPFALGLCILFFPTIVLGTINGLLSPIAQGCHSIVESQTFDLQKYKEEREAREHSEKMLQKMDESSRELVRILHQYRVKDPTQWVHQAQALTNPKEMVEIRHSLIIQRQRLRKRIDFNHFNMESAKEEIEDLVKKYPKYAKEILAIVSQYE